MNHIRIGTRGSPLALAQARETSKALVAAHNLDPGQIEIVAITTTGDRIPDRSLSDIGGKGLFTKEIEDALFDGSIDLAVHSMKDMPALIPDGLDFAAVLPREDPRDAFISLSAATLMDLPPGARLGSSSVRRTAQALAIRPDLKNVPFRGNVGTRLKKLSENIADATFLAVAGLNRLGLADKITSIMAIDEMLPAVAQGAISIEIQKGNDRMRALVAAINHDATWQAVLCERVFLAALDGSCRTPIAGHATVSGSQIHFRGQTLTLDGRNVFAAMRTGPVMDAIRLGREAAAEVKTKGGSLIAGP